MIHIKPILLVDNDKRTVDLLRLILEGEGYKVDTAFNGMSAIDKVQDKGYALVILDYAARYEGR